MIGIDLDDGARFRIYECLHEAGLDEVACYSTMHKIISKLNEYSVGRIIFQKSAIDFIKDLLGNLGIYNRAKITDSDMDALAKAFPDMDRLMNDYENWVDNSGSVNVFDFIADILDCEDKETCDGGNVPYPISMLREAARLSGVKLHDKWGWDEEHTGKKEE
jgi:hypothetical protein